MMKKVYLNERTQRAVMSAVAARYEQIKHSDSDKSSKRD